tara:strand:- start:1265 stop:1687 length:423 start_codon:yes stop_codon:yes gene_type:complete
MNTEKMKEELVKTQIEAFNNSIKNTEDVFNKCFKTQKTQKTQNEKYILKDSLNTYISMHNTEDEVYEKLQEFSKKFKDSFSTFGGHIDGRPMYEDSAVYTIPEELKRQYNNKEYITFYFFKFDLKTNERVALYDYNENYY